MMAIHWTANTLLEQIAAPENLLAAWRAVRGNIPKYRRVRSAGPDGVSLAEFERDLPAQLSALRAMLLEGRYHPGAPARFLLPKRSGGQRQISILAVRDRVAQRAAQQVIEPLWEPEFLDCSFGFRPGLSIEQAIGRAQELRSGGRSWVVDGDIAACFDSLDHDLLMDRLRARIGDGRVLGLLQAWLDGGVLQAGLPQELPGEAGEGLKTISTALQRGVDLAIEAAVEDRAPYRGERWREAAGLEEFGEARGSEDWQAELRRTAMKRTVASGLLWGASLARPAIARLGRSVQSNLSEMARSPAGRRLLKKSALTTGGLAGVAAAAAAAAYLLQRKAGPAPAGVLQGSPLSPLLANIYLHPFDESITRRKHCLVRFADDWVILCATREQAEAAFNDARRALARLRLKMNPEKTQILAAGEKLEWLGAIIA